MHPEHKMYLRLLKQVSRFAVETAFIETPQSKRTISSNEMLSCFHISRADFLTHLYQPRGIEEEFLKSIIESRDLVVIVGPRGAGKTSLSLHLIDQINKSPEKYRVCYIDFRAMDSLHNFSVRYYDQTSRQQGQNDGQLNNDKQRNIESLCDRIDALVIADYYNRVFPLTPNQKGDISRFKLWEFVLTYYGDWPGTDLELSRTCDKLRRLFKVYSVQTTAQQSALTYYNWLDDRYYQDDTLWPLLDKLSGEMKVTHLIDAAKHLYGFELQIIWADNVDVLPVELQSEIIDRVKKYLNLVADYARVVATVREENALSRKSLEPGAPPHTTVMLLLKNRGKEKIAGRYIHPDNPVLDTYSIDREFLSGVVRRRLYLTKERLNRIAQTIAADLAKSSSSLFTAETQNQVARLSDLQAAYGPSLTEQRYRSLEVLSTKILAVFVSIDVMRLVNDSLREFLIIHRDFLSDLLASANDDRVKEIIQYDARHIATLFFRWIRYERKALKFGAYDIIKETEAWHQGKQDQPGCIISHLIINTIWNLTLENHEHQFEGARYHPARVKEVLRRISELGYREDEILQGIYSLYAVDNHRGHCIEIRERKFLNNKNDIRDDHIVYVTPRGKLLVSYFCNTFGYLYECIRNYEEPDANKERLEVHEEPSATEKVNKILPYLCDIADMHYRSLLLLRNCMQGGHDWMNKYRAWFGVPRHLRRETNREAIGSLIHGVRRALHYECIIDGIISYFGRANADERLKTLEHTFAKAVNSLETANKPFVDFRFAVGLGARRSVRRP